MILHISVALITQPFLHIHNYAYYRIHDQQHKLSVTLLSDTNRFSTGPPTQHQLFRTKDPYDVHRPLQYMQTTFTIRRLWKIHEVQQIEAFKPTLRALTHLHVVQMYNLTFYFAKLSLNLNVKVSLRNVTGVKEQKFNSNINFIRLLLPKCH